MINKNIFKMIDNFKLSNLLFFIIKKLKFKL